MSKKHITVLNASKKEMMYVCMYVCVSVCKTLT